MHEVGPRVTVKKIRGDVPRHEVAEWIRGRLASGEYQNPAEWRAGRFMGISEFSSACGVDQRYIRMILDGYMIKKGRRVPYDWVSYDLVDRMLQNEGTTTLDDLFPLEELDEAA